MLAHSVGLVFAEQAGPILAVDADLSQRARRELQRIFACDKESKAL
jgi:hypothetical protein